MRSLKTDGLASSLLSIMYLMFGKSYMEVQMVVSYLGDIEVQLKAIDVLMAQSI